MELAILSGRGNRPLAREVAGELGLSLGEARVEEFPDGELEIQVPEEITGADLYLIQPTGPPVTLRLQELLLLADAARRCGAFRITAVLPYFGYARQDRRTFPGEPVGARVIADQLAGCVDRLVAVDLHNPSLEGFISKPLHHLSAVPLLARKLRETVSEEMVLVAPDLGAVKLAQRFADELDLPVAYVDKVRRSGREVEARRVVGEVGDRLPVVVDDMISTGGTLAAAVEAILERGAQSEVTVAVSHSLLVGDAVETLSRLPLHRLLTTDSLEGLEEFARLPLERVGLAGLLAVAIEALHHGRTPGLS